MLKKIVQNKIFYIGIVIMLMSCVRQKEKLIEPPEENRFKRTVITEDLSRPMAFEISVDGKIYLIESGGNLKIIESNTGKSKIAGTLKLFDPGEFGLIGMALDPDFLKNHWIYFKIFFILIFFMNVLIKYYDNLLLKRKIIRIEN